MTLDFKSLKAWMGYVAIVAAYIQQKPEVLNHFSEPWKGILWEVTSFVMWLAAAGYLVMRSNSVPAKPLDEVDAQIGGPLYFPATPPSGDPPQSPAGTTPAGLRDGSPAGESSSVISNQ